MKVEKERSEKIIEREVKPGTPNKNVPSVTVLNLYSRIFVTII